MQIRKTRLVLACINLLAAVLRLVAALVDMASNYHSPDDCQMDQSV